MRKIRKYFLCALVLVQVILTMQPLSVIAKNNIEEKFNQKVKTTVERLNAIDSSEYDLTTTTPINRVADKSKTSVFFNDKGKKNVDEKVDISTTKMVNQQVGRQKERVRNYIINTNDFNSIIPEKLNNENRIRITREDTIIELLPMFNDFVQFYASKDTLTFISDKRSVLYNYFAYNDSFKEEIVLYEPQESYTYYYELTIENGTLSLIDQQYFVISNTNKRLFEFSAPVIVDAIGSINEEIGINIYPTDNGYHIEVKVDDVWMNDDDRVYPIIIDPEFKAITQDPDTMIYSEIPNQNYVYDDVLTVGFSGTDEYRPFFKLDDNKIIELIAEGALLDNATFDLYVLDSTKLEQQEIQLCVLNQAIDPYQANWNNSNQIPATCFVVDYTIAQQLTNHEDFFQLLSENPIDDTLTYQIEQGTPLVAINDQQLYYLFDQDDNTYIYSDNGDSLVEQSVIVDLKRFIRPETITLTFGGDFDSSKESLLLTFINSNTDASITQLVTNSMSSSNQVENHQMIIQLEPSLLLFDQMKISTFSSQTGGKPRINEIQINNYQLEENYLQLDISDYLQQLIDQEIDNYGFYLKMSASTDKRIDFLSNDNGDHQPTMQVSYESTYDVSLLYPLTDLTLNVVSDISYVNMKASLESVTFNGIATPGSDVKLYLRELNNADNIVDGEEISNIGTSFIENSNYNYKSFHHFTTEDLKQNGVYQVEVIAEKDGQSSQSVSVVFMIAYLNYFNSLADLAFFYGVEVSVLIADNNITQDLDPQSVIFVRNPKRNIGKSYSSASIDYINETQTTDYMLGTNHYNEYYEERVNINTGNYHLSHQDMQYMMFGEQIKLTRAYNSKNTINLSQFGTNWDYDFNYVLMNYDDDKLVFKKEDGQRIYFKKEGDVYQAQNNDSHKLTKTANEFVIEAKDKKYYFSLSGQIDKVVFNNGYEINYIYDDNERISRIVLQNMDELALTYDDTGLITSISYVATKEDKRVIAQTIEYNYDQLGRLIEVIDPLGYVVSYSYDELNRIVSWCDKNANVVDQITYDNQNRVITLVDTNDITNDFTYYSNKGYTDWYQNDLMIKKVYYDQAFKTEKVVYNDGAQTGKTYYQENGQVNVEKLMNNATLTYTYDDNQNIETITRSDGKTRYFTYDIENNLLSETDYLGNVTQYSYENNLLVQTDYADGSYEEYTYQNRLLVTYKDQMGNTTSYQYDDKGRRVLTTYADDISETVQYNLMGYTSRITNNDGYKKVIARNFRNEIVFETTYEGSITQTSYDGNGNVISLTDGNGHTRNFYYDTSNNLVKEIDPYGNYLLNIYDNHRNLIKQDKYDSEDNIIESGTAYLYDQYHRLLQAVNPNGSKTEYQYNRNGELERKVDNTITQESLFTIYRYDQFINKVIQEHQPDGNVVTYSYDANGNIIEMVAMDGLRTVYEYDVMNRLIRQIDDFGVESIYTYDLKGNLLSTTKDTTVKVHYSNWSDWQLASESGITSNHSIITKTQYRQKEYEEIWVKGYEYLDYLFLDEERELNSTQNWAHTNGLGLQWQLGYAGTVTFDSGEPANFYGYKDYGSLAHCGVSTQGTDSGGTYCKKFYYYFLEYKFGGYPLSFGDWQDETIITNERNIVETQLVYSLDGDAYSTVINPSIDDSELIDKEALLNRKYYDTEGFSPWSETVVLPQANRVIETRFLYREKKLNSIWSSNVSEPGYSKSSIKQEESQISGYMHTSTMGFNWVNGFMGETTYNSKYVNVYGYKDYEYAKWGSCPLVKNDAGGSYCEKTRFKYVNYKYDSSGEFQEWQEDAIIKTINNIIEVKKEYRYEDHTYSDYLMSANETYPFESENILDEVYLRVRSKMVIPNNSVIMINDEFDVMAGVSAYNALGNDITEDITLNVDSIDTTTAGIIEVIYSLDDLQVLRVIEIVSNNESQIDGNWITLEPSSTVVATSANVELVSANDYTQYLISSNEWVTGLQEQPSSVPSSGNYRLIALDPYYRERAKTIEVFNNNQVSDPSYLLIGHLDTVYGQWESRIIDWDACSINNTAPTYGGIDNEIIKYFSSSISGYWTNTFYNNNYYANYSHVRCGYQVRYKYGTNYPNSHVAYMIQEHTRDFSERYQYYHFGTWSNWESGTLVTNDYYDRENQVNYKYLDGVLSEWIPVGVAVPENYYEVQTQTLYTYRVKRTLTALDYVLVNTGDEINLTDYYSYFDPRDGDIDEMATLSLGFLDTDLSDEIDGSTFVFNEIGNYQLTVITDEGSKQIEISVRESIGSRVTENIYDVRNRVIKTIDAENNIYEHFYYSNRLIKVVDPIGSYVVYTYDQDDHITKEEVFDNLDICVSMYSYTYDKMGNRLSVTDIDGYSTYYVYNANNQVKQVKRPMFDLDDELTYAIEQFEYDVSGRVVKHTNPYGLITRNYYDQMGYLTSVTSQLDATSIIVEKSIAYDINGNMTELVDKGVSTTFEYNEFNDLIKKVSASGLNTYYEYDSNHRLIKEIYTDSDDLVNIGDNKREIQYQYNNLGELCLQKDTLGKTKLMFYDQYGNQEAIKDFNGNFEQAQYNNNDQVTLKIDARKNYTYMYYDSRGNLKTLVTPNKAITHFGYDALNNQVSIVDALGNTTLYEYNMYSLQTRIVDSKNQVTIMTYTPDQKVNSISYQDDDDNEVKRLEYSYDLLGNMIQETIIYTNPLDEMMDYRLNQYVYDAYSQLKTSINANNNVTNYDYDNNHRLVKTTYPNGLETINIYDSVTGALISTRQVDSNLIGGSQRNTFYEYNVYGEVSKQTYANNSFVEMNYSADGQITSVSYSNNDLQDTSDDHVITYYYDLNGQLITTLDNGGYDQTTDSYQTRVLETRTYNNYGEVVSITNLNGLVTSFDYDQYGRLIRTTEKDVEHSSYENSVFVNQTSDLVTTTTYDLLDRVVSVSEPNGLLTTNVYDELGNIIQVITSVEETDITTSYTYDRFNNVITTTDSLNQTINTIYNALNQLVKTIEPTLESMVYEYDDNGNLIKQEYFSADLSKSEKIEYVFNNMDQLVQTKEYRTTNGVLTPYFTTNTYTKFGELASVQDPTGYTILYQYDDMGNKIHADHGDQNEIEYEYDKNSRLIQVVYSTRNLDLYNQFTITETYEYYRDGKLRLYVPNQPANNNTETKKVYYYYQNDQLSSKVTTLSHIINDQEVISAQDTVNYLYDQRGQLTELSDKLGKTLNYYDESSNLTQQIRIDQLVTYDNDHNELTRVDQTSQTVGYSYDSYHNQTAIIYPDNTIVVYEYDELQRLSSVTDQNGTTTYTYDPVDNELTETLPSGEISVTTYQLGKVTRKLTTYFDTQLNQLITLVDQSITYDETGNVLTDTLIKNEVTTITQNTYDERSQLLSSTKTEGIDKVEYNYVHDPFGNKNEVIKYFSNDILIGSNTKSYTYNHLNQLASATIDNVLVNYEYDAYGNLVSEDDGTTEITYTYDLANNLIAYDDGTNYQFTYDGSGKRLSKQVDSMEIRYVNDASKANEQVLTYTVLNTTFKLTYGLKRLYEDDKAYIYDSYGNVIIHDDKQYAYSPYGSLSEGMIDGYNEYGYKGEVHDNQSLQYLRARYYHTKLTQFISIDTYRGSDSNPLSQNRYSFAGNNPYKYSDPSGHFIISLEGYKVYIAGSAAQRQASTSSSTVPTVDKPLTENQINDIIDSYNPGPSNTNLAWRFLVQEKLQADYLAQQKAIEDAIPKGAKIAHEEFNRTVTQEAYDDYLEQVRQNAKTNEEGILSKIGNFVTGFVKAYINIDAFKNLATSTWEFFSNPQENFNLKSFGNYLDSNLQNIALVAGTFGAMALGLSALPFLATSSALLGTIATYTGLTMGIVGGIQIASGVVGYSLAGDKLSTTDRIYRVMSGGLNVLGGNSQLKRGLKLTQNNSKILTGITNTIDSVVAKTVSTVKDIGRRVVNSVKTGITNVYNGAKNLAVSGIRKANSYISAGYNKAKNYIIEKADKVYKTVFNKDRKNIFGDLSEAANYGVKPYSVLRKELKETALEAHHIVERRLAEALGIKNAKSMLSVAVTAAEHQPFTNRWRQLIPYGTDYGKLKPDEIWEAAQKIYENFPELLEVARKTIFR